MSNEPSETEIFNRYRSDLTKIFNDFDKLVEEKTLNYNNFTNIIINLGNIYNNSLIKPIYIVFNKIINNSYLFDTYNKIAKLLITNVDNLTLSKDKDIYAIISRYTSEKDTLQMLIDYLKKTKTMENVLLRSEDNLETSINYCGTNHDFISFNYLIAFEDTFICDNNDIILNCSIDISDMQPRLTQNDKIYKYGKFFFKYCYNIKELFNECKANNKFIIFSVGITDSKEQYGHVNCLIYNPLFDEIEHFEPVGFKNYKMYSMGTLNETADAIEKFVKENISNTVKFISGAKECNHVGFQGVYKNEKHGKGICYLWTVWYIKQRLKYPNTNAKDTYEKIKKKYSTFKYGGTLADDMMDFRDELTSKRKDILANPKLPENAKHLFLNSWLMYHTNITNIDDLMKTNSQLIKDIANIVNDALSKEIKLPLLPKTSEKLKNIYKLSINELKYLRGRLTHIKRLSRKYKDKIFTDEWHKYKLRNLDKYSKTELNELEAELDKFLQKSK